MTLFTIFLVLSLNISSYTYAAQQQAAPTPPETSQQQQAAPTPPETSQQQQAAPTPPETPQQQQAAPTPPETPQQQQAAHFTLPVSIATLSRTSSRYTITITSIKENNSKLSFFVVPNPDNESAIPIITIHAPINGVYSLTETPLSHSIAITSLKDNQAFHFDLPKNYTNIYVNNGATVKQNENIASTRWGPITFSMIQGEAFSPLCFLPDDSDQSEFTYVLKNFTQLEGCPSLESTPLDQ